MIWLQEKYLLLLSSSLSVFKKRANNSYSFRCPYCGDSKKSKTKVRGNIYPKNNDLIYHCFNCGVSRIFDAFLKDQNDQLYNEYKIENMKEKGVTRLPSRSKPKPKADTVKSIFKGLYRISDLNLDHFAKRFVTSRKIPGKFHGVLYFVPRYVSFVNTLIPNKLKGKDGPRLIIPFYSYGNKIAGFQGRALDDDPLRYSTIVIDEDLPRAFNLNKVNMNKKFYVTEGPIDSMFLDNAIAIGGSDLVGGVRNLNGNRENAVIVFDNEPRNSQIVSHMYQAVKNNFSIVVWPNYLTQKDINDMVLSGYNPSEVQSIIDQNTFSGLQAEMALAAWKKIAA